MNIGNIFKNKKGQAMVEIAIIIPILIIILMTIFEFGRIFNTYLIMTHASREGARSAALGCNDTEVSQAVNNSVAYLDASNLTISITPTKSSRTRGSNVTVNLKYDLDIIVPVIDKILPDPFNIESQTSMRVE